MGDHVERVAARSASERADRAAAAAPLARHGFVDEAEGGHGERLGGRARGPSRSGQAPRRRWEARWGGRRASLQRASGTLSPATGRGDRTIAGPAWRCPTGRRRSRHARASRRQVRASAGARTRRVPRPSTSPGRPTWAGCVALKELTALPVSDPSTARRFVRESRLAGSLNHPNIVTVHDFFEDNGTPYIAMEYLERGSLRPLMHELRVRAGRRRRSKACWPVWPTRTSAGSCIATSSRRT